MQSTIVVQNIDILHIVDTFQKIFFLIICLQFKIINVEMFFELLMQVCSHLI